MIIAYCERCGGVWNVRRDRNPMLMEGVCLECQDESDTEKPLAFGLLFGNAEMPEDLPEGYLYEA
jgi:hypothetical protein